MNSCSLTEKKCVPCEGGVPPLAADKVNALLTEVPQWSLAGKRIKRVFRFQDFKQNLTFVNQMAEVAELEGHHPDFSVHYNELTVEIWTHAIGGLSENDFILAAKIDALL